MRVNLVRNQDGVIIAVLIQSFFQGLQLIVDTQVFKHIERDLSEANIVFYLTNTHEETKSYELYPTNSVGNTFNDLPKLMDGWQ